MTIRPGEDWGIETPRPADPVVVHQDSAIVSAPVGRDIVIAGGDLYRSVGEPSDRDPVRRVDVDGLAVRLDGNDAVAGIAHVVIRRGWWRGWVIAVMNVDHLGAWYVAPRAHPNDGRFDVVAADPSLGLRHRFAARRRLPTGTHIPHPAITTSRHAVREWTFERAHRVWVDGRLVGRARHVGVVLEPDRYVVHF